MQHHNIVHVVDPDEAIGEALSALLGTYGIYVRAFSDAESFLRARSSWGSDPGCLLIEANLPGLNGLSLLRQLRDQGSSLPVIVLTTTQNSALERQALQFGATEVIEKSLINAFLVGRLPELLPGIAKFADSASKD